MRVPLPYLALDGVAVANAAETLQYLRNGLAASDRFDVAPGDPCGAMRRDAVTSGVYPWLGLYPHVTGLYPSGVDVFTDPTLDRAPWFDPTDPETAEFLGVLIDSWDGFDGDAAREQTQRYGGVQGVAFGAEYLTGRDMNVHGWLIGASCRGLEAGRRWLTQALEASGDPCATRTATIRMYCPTPDDGSNDTDGVRVLYEVALKAGPSVVTMPDCCDVAEVSFTLTAGNPFLYTARQTCVSAAQVSAGNLAGGSCISIGTWLCTRPDPVGCAVAAPQVGTVSPVVTISAGADASINGLYVWQAQPLYPYTQTFPSACTYPSSDACGSPTFPTGAVCPVSMYFPSIPAGTTVVVDNARRRIYQYGADLVQYDASGLLSLPASQSIAWIDAQAAAACVQAGVTAFCAASSTAVVTIETQTRER